MNELSELQESVLSIVQEHSNKSLFDKSDCVLTNKQIFSLIKPESKRPVEPKYLTLVLKRLAIRGKVSIKTTSPVGFRGRKRVITIL